MFRAILSVALLTTLSGDAVAQLTPLTDPLPRSAPSWSFDENDHARGLGRKRADHHAPQRRQLRAMLRSALLGGELSRELFAPIDAKIWLDGESAETESITGLVARTIAEPGLPVRPLSPTVPENECFHLAISRAGPAALGLAAALQGLGLDGAALASDEREVRSLEIRFGDRTAYAVDTDALPATAVLRVEP